MYEGPNYSASPPTLVRLFLLQSFWWVWCRISLWAWPAFPWLMNRWFNWMYARRPRKRLFQKPRWQMMDKVIAVKIVKLQSHVAQRTWANTVLRDLAWVSPALDHVSKVTLVLVLKRNVAKPQNVHCSNWHCQIIFGNSPLILSCSFPFPP